MFDLRPFVLSCVLLFISYEGYAYQHYVADNLYSTAEKVLTYGTGAEDLYAAVTMYYDCVDDITIESCAEQTWMPPLQYSSQNDYWKLYVKPGSCLGVGGPLGPLGVLSSFGPLGQNLSNYDHTWVSGSFNGTCDWCKSIIDFFNNLRNNTYVDPLGMNGPLGYLGPLSTFEVYSVMYHLNEPVLLANNFPTNLDITGVWGVLGPLSILSPFGALGPLGILYQLSVYSVTNPATGLPDGQYRNVDTGAIVRTLEMQYSSTVYRVYDLFELYPPATAVQLGDSGMQDSSFGVESKLQSPTKVDNYKFCSNYNQTVTVLVLPIIHNSTNVYAEVLSDFDISILNANNQVIMQSSSNSSTAVYPLNKLNNYHGLIDWIIFRATSGQCLTASVSAKSLSTDNPYYRLFIVGDGFLEGDQGAETDANMFNHQNIFGTFQDFY